MVRCRAKHRFGNWGHQKGIYVVFNVLLAVIHCTYLKVTGNLNIRQVDQSNIYHSVTPVKHPRSTLKLGVAQNINLGYFRFIDLRAGIIEHFCNVSIVKSIAAIVWQIVKVRGPLVDIFRRMVQYHHGSVSTTGSCLGTMGCMMHGVVIYPVTCQTTLMYVTVFFHDKLLKLLNTLSSFHK